MRDLIQQIRDAIPLDLPETDICGDDCNGCSMKLLEFLRNELDDWSQRLDDGEVPGLADLSRLARTAKKIRGILRNNGLSLPETGKEGAASK